MLSALDRKLVRDLAHLRGQLAAVALVVACGIAVLVMMRNNHASLLASRDAYYGRYDFADVFASLVRAPAGLVARLAEIPGVARVDARVSAEVTLDVPGLEEPATGRVLSLPRGRDALNRVHVRRGRLPEPGARDEVLVSEAFADANRLSLGATLGAVLDGRWRPLRVVGVGLSPEFIYALGAGSLFPDDRRYGILWMDEEPLAAAFDLDGAFNDVALALAPGASPPAVIAALDRLLEPYGGLGAHDRERQLSHRFISDEIQGLRTNATIIPVVFLAIAAFLTHMVLNRLVALQRDQIAVLKAFGYGSGEVGWHFVKLGLAAVVAGGALGALLGWWSGKALATYYTVFFHFPALEYVAPPAVLAVALLVSGGSAALGALAAARTAARLPPAEAMRPEPPARFRATVLERLGLQRAIPPAARIIVRNLERRPLQTTLSVLGISLAVAMLVVGYFAIDAVHHIGDLQFRTVQREDVTVGFEGPRSERARWALARVPGVLRVEPFRAVSARLVAGHRERDVGILGFDPDAELRVLVDREGRRVPLAPGGLVLTTALADLLGVRAGDTVRVEVLQETRPVRRVPVVQLVDELVGTAAYMQRGDLDVLVGGARAVSGAWLAVDEARAAEVYAALKRTPAVASVGVRAAMLRSFDETIAANLRVSIAVLVAFAAVIAFGVVYNAARIALSERGRELASLRVLGFTRHEVSVMLLGEQALLTLLALPVGCLLGYWLTALIVDAMSTELFRMPLVVSARTFAASVLWVVAAAVVSGVAVWRRVQRLDLIAVLKSRE